MFPGRVNIRDVSDGDLSLFASRGCGNNGGSVPAKQTLASVAPEQVGLCQRLREVVSRKELCRSDVITGRGACGHLLQVDGELAGVEGTTFAEFLPGDDNFIPRFHKSCSRRPRLRIESAGEKEPSGLFGHFPKRPASLMDKRPIGHRGERWLVFLLDVMKMPTETALNFAFRISLRLRVPVVGLRGNYTALAQQHLQISQEPCLIFPVCHYNRTRQRCRCLLCPYQQLGSFLFRAVIIGIK